MNSILVIMLFALPLQPDVSPPPTIEGSWSFVKEKSSDLATWKSWTPQLEISTVGDQVRIVQNWMERNQIAHAGAYVRCP